MELERIGTGELGSDLSRENFSDSGNKTDKTDKTGTGSAWWKWEKQNRQEQTGTGRQTGSAPVSLSSPLPSSPPSLSYTGKGQKGHNFTFETFFIFHLFLFLN